MLPRKRPNRILKPKRVKVRHGSRKGIGKGIKSSGFVVPVNPLPEEVVDRVRRIIARRGEEFLGRLKNADARKTFLTIRNLKDNYHYYRVRGANVRKSEGIVLKWSHDPPSTVIGNINRMVEQHNRKTSLSLYELRLMSAYEIGEQLILMPKIEMPSLEEIIPGLGNWPTKRGIELMQEIKARFEVDEQRLKLAWKALQKNIERFAKQAKFTLKKPHFLLLGFENDRFVFMPLMDLE